MYNFGVSKKVNFVTRDKNEVVYRFSTLVVNNPRAFIWLVPIMNKLWLECKNARAWHADNKMPLQDCPSAKPLQSFHYCYVCSDN